MQTQTLRQWSEAIEYRRTGYYGGSVSVVETQPGQSWSLTLTTDDGCRTLSPSPLLLRREQAAAVVRLLTAALETLPPPETAAGGCR